MLVFHGQNITDEQQTGVLRCNFGERENARGGTVTKKEDYRLDIRAERRLQPRQGRQAAAARQPQRICSTSATALWHSDSSFRPIPAKFSLLSARVVNPKGGNTEFADMRAAYDALDDETKAEIEDLVCEHSLMYSRGSLGFLDYTDEEKADVQAGAAAAGAHASGASAASRCICRRMPAPSSA